VSIGSDSVYAVEEYLAAGKQKEGKTAIEQISRVYGAQAVVVSIDPRRVWVASPEDTTHHTVKSSKTGEAAAEPVDGGLGWPGAQWEGGRNRFFCRWTGQTMRSAQHLIPQFVAHACVCCALPAGPNGEQYCWWQCTVMGGREGRDVDAVQLAQARSAAAPVFCGPLLPCLRSSCLPA
jgi:imidazole glycerol phosphate synthase subunit HisF